MTAFFERWSGLALRTKTGIIAGIVLIAALTIGLSIWIYSTDYQILFADINPSDAASMTAELDRMKIPYQLAEGGNTILVPKDLVYKTRLKLMGKDLPLRGAVGFEVFNNADFGMTEFVQKVNYQRAIQGELTRTILSIDDIQSARVHLALPEQGLFKKNATKPKASVTLIMKPGHVLANEQISGIQRLVAASVPDIVSNDVTILDQHGVALTRVAASESGTDIGGNQLDLKKTAEEYLTRKVSLVLERTFGPGEAIATVDVSLNLDQSRITTEDVLPAHTQKGPEGNPTGSVVRERQTVKDAPAPQAGSSRDAQQALVTSSESEYQNGRRVEQIVSAPGATKRMTIAVVVKRPLTDIQLDKVKEIVGLAAGFNPQRGDAIVVSSMNKLVSAEPVNPDGITAANAATSADSIADHVHPTPSKRSIAAGKVLASFWPIVISAALVIITFLVAGLHLSGRNRQKKIARQLATDRRTAVLKDVQQWIQAPAQQDSVVGAYK